MDAQILQVAMVVPVVQVTPVAVEQIAMVVVHTDMPIVKTGARSSQLSLVVVTFDPPPLPVPIIPADVVTSTRRSQPFKIGGFNIFPLWIGK